LFEKKVKKEQQRIFKMHENKREALSKLERTRCLISRTELSEECKAWLAFKTRLKDEIEMIKLNNADLKKDYQWMYKNDEEL
jgi:hypothetical protein